MSWQLVLLYETTRKFLATFSSIFPIPFQRMDKKIKGMLNISIIFSSRAKSFPYVIFHDATVNKEDNAPILLWNL